MTYEIIKNLNHGMMNEKCCHSIYRKRLRCIAKMIYAFYEEHAQHNFLKKDTIGIVLPGHYRWLDHQCHAAVMWMVVEEQERGAAIPYEGNGREVRFMGRKVDGLAKEGNVTNCFPNGRDKAITNNSSETINTQFESTMAKRTGLLYGGCRLVEIWECNFQECFQENEEMKTTMIPHRYCRISSISSSETLFFYLQCLFSFNMKLTGDSSVFQHVPVLCIAHCACKNCYGAEDSETLCTIHGIKQQILESISCIRGFQVFHITNFGNVICIAHNLKGYNGQFLMKQAISNIKMTPEVFLTGTKIMTMRVNNIKFLDTLNFLPMPLAKLPKTLNVANDLMKGFFPHFFNTVENKNYVVPLLQKTFYG
ncbi:hypothetical protein J437_LFUL018335 [Ladona fulva]|uniref:DNA-directed DNA polymerase n=1 Tax=Ladona fulva TaxID=123851 RepID=A0A8K0KN45_LADFU|nr:hypothetical protein J437_LFUL018335 [Ladona fulva]